MKIKFKKSNLPYMLISLLFSLILFFNVNSQNVSQVFSSDTNYEKSIDNVPIDVQYDSDKYFVHGFSSTVSVKLNGANRIQLNKEVDSDTRDFTIVADLSNLGPGTHEVKLKTKNLSSSLYAQIEPKTISVTIEKKKTEEYSVSPVLSSTTSNDGLKIGEMSVKPSKVKITTGEDTMKQIDRVVASVDSSKLTTDQDSIEAQVQALNSSGEALAIQSNPQNVVVTFEIETPSKEVSLYPIQEGDLPSNVDSVQIDLNRTTATISGAQSVIDKIDSIGIPVDVSQIQGTVKKFIDVPVSGDFQVDPKTVSAQVAPTFKETQETESSSTNHSSSMVSESSHSTGNDSSSEKSSSTTVESSTTTTTTSVSQEKTVQSTN